MNVDRNMIVYNKNARTYRNKHQNNKNDDVNKSMQVTNEKFLDSDESSDSDDDNSKLKQKQNTVKKPHNDYSFDEEYDLQDEMRKFHDMTYMASDHDVMFGASILNSMPNTDDSFFLTKKKQEGDESPSKRLANELNQDGKPSSPSNPLKNLNRIQKLRHMKGSIINAHRIPDHEHIDSIFNNESSLRRHISLSIYSRPKSILGKKTATNDYNDSMYATEPTRGQQRDKNAPLEKYQSSHSQQRTNQINEIWSLKDDLTKNDVNISVTTIEKAILFPEDRPPEKRSYPKISDLLFKNPFEKKTKKKKKGKKKK